MSLRIAISLGDYNGIGPEIILKTLPQITAAGATPVVIGHQHIFQFYAHLLDIPLPKNVSINAPDNIEEGIVNFLNVQDQPPQPTVGELSKQAGKFAMQAVEQGINLCVNRKAHALVTAPISKEAVNKAGYHIPGHTEFLAKKTNTADFMMMLVHDKLRVGLVTIHIPVAEIAGQITMGLILKSIRLLNTTLKDDFNIAEPRIAVLGLNPHAGDGGIIGQEEIDIITPAIVKSEAQNRQAEGPFPADGFFGNHQYKAYDGVLAMYHDQGLVPFKTISFGGGVNVTCGLPIVRTSPDHGTAFDIAGKNIANPASFLEATKLAITLAKNRFQIA